MRGWVALWVAAAVAGCGDESGGGPPDGSAADASRLIDAAPEPGDDAAGSDAAPVCDDTPALPPPITCAQTGSWAAYIGDEIVNGREEIFVLTMDGDPGEPAAASDSHNVARTQRPTWGFSPDAAAIAFVTNPNNEPWELYAVPITAAGPGEIREVSGPFKVDGNVLWYAWSPDGRKIAYVANQEHEAFELWVLDLESPGYAKRVSPSLEIAGGITWNFEIPFVWSPDSSKLLFQGRFDDPEQDDLYVVDLGGAAPAAVALTSDIDTVPWRFGWSPDSSAVAFTTLSGAGLFLARVTCGVLDGPHVVAAAGAFAEKFSPDGHELYYFGPGNMLYRADVTVTPPLSSPISEPAPDLPDQPKWSPTGIRLAFKDGRRLGVLDGVTGEWNLVNGPLVANGQVREFAWSPDGNSIAYTASQDDVFQLELFHVDMSGQRPARRRQVSLDTAYNLTVGPEVLWSPDSSHLAYRANQDVETRDELYVAERVAGVPAVPVRMNAALQRDGAAVFSFRWSPDGARLLYNANDAGAFIADAFVVGLSAPGDATQINGAPDAVEVAWAPCPAP